LSLSKYHYELPLELIAQHPPPSREDSRLLVLSPGSLQHRAFPDLLEYLSPGDLVVFNDTRVFPARLFGRRSETGGKAEVLLLHPAAAGGWNVLLRPSRRGRPGTKLEFPGGLRGSVRGRDDTGTCRMEFSPPTDLIEYAWRYGTVPLPPYIRRGPAVSEELSARDSERYQTVYAARDGAVAAPTAGLHFTPEFLRRMEQKGVEREFVTLHVGPGTFRPVRVEDLAQHRMHSEHYEVGPAAAERINRQLRSGRRLWLVGTTAVRALESAADEEGLVSPGRGWTDIFIRPGYRWRLSFNLVTNFHLPASTLLMLVSALAGRERILAAYAEAIRSGYRFFSYGDAMAILRTDCPSAK